MRPILNLNFATFLESFSRKAIARVNLVVGSENQARNRQEIDRDAGRSVGVATGSWPEMIEKVARP